MEQGVVRDFDLQTGNGFITTEKGDDVFFNFTAIPGEGYRTIKSGTAVKFELVKGKFGLSARNIQLMW
ncbi:cold shock domain-containing protein [Chlorogloeopsis sp. ULAP01]|uniref:cold-shock protein n=1 Tax=Chlorogloeopsis sp. ULAP01 TaxID=3056483 RepID=UPI0030157528